MVISTEHLTLWLNKQVVMRILGISLIIACISVLGIQAQTKAFPTAEGFGSNATGGRGGKVVEVTTVEDDATNPPEGSLRWALKQYPNDPLTVVFRVSGIIDLKADLRSKRDNYTIAGQTAPGDGICIMGDKVNLGGSNNLIVRHLRFRIGTMIDENGQPDANGKGSIGIENATNFILDHCTFGWSGEENMTIYDNKNTTIQWCIVHEGLYNSGHGKGARGYGAQWGGQNVTFHHNLLAHNYNRSPRFNGARSNDINVLIDYVNNVNYNWGKANSCYGSDIENVSNRTNMVNNYYKPGPARPGTSSSYFTQSSFSSSQTTSKIALWYMSGNIMEGSANEAKNTDNYLGLDASAYTSKGVSADALKSETPFEIAFPVTTETAEEAYESVLAGAGAFPRDAVDSRIVEEVETGTASGSGSYDNGAVKGIIDDPEAVGGYPEYVTGEALVDSDHDGMPDAWEIENNLNPNDPDDRNLLTKAGYTVLEVYLNALAGEVIELDLVTSLDEIRNNNYVNISKKGNTLFVGSGELAVSSLKIYNLLGQQVIHKSEDTSFVDISALSTGIYILEVRTNDRMTKTLKFSKN
jgi:pectate lyase